ncbi:MAG TPA: hypothetical protein DCS31_05885 [Candidatus Competibacteraceae bacterium]|jgi:hypothetical protein|nr:hypothetical protein [Candidatus Competibacteraceae bacterium]
MEQYVCPARAGANFAPQPAQMCFGLVMAQIQPYTIRTHKLSAYREMAIPSMGDGPTVVVIPSQSFAIQRKQAFIGVLDSLPFTIANVYRGKMNNVA